MTREPEPAATDPGYEQRRTSFAGVARALPSGALGDFLRSACRSGRADWGALAVLVVWGLAAAGATARWFRWD